MFCIYFRIATSAPYNINWFVFITEMESVYCAVRIGSLNKAVCASSLKGWHLETVSCFSSKVKESRNRPGVAQRIPGGLGSQISRHSAREGGEVVSLMHRPPLAPGMFLVLIFTRGWVDPRAMVRSEGETSLKNPVTRPRIDPGTVRLVAQRLNHYAAPGPRLLFYRVN
jgi:hypothetical protein